MQLSLSMIVRNEAERLERCLASVADFVDEMVIVDTGSNDGTVAIAEGCGAVVHHLDWPGDFAPARNAALDLVQGEWVLVLDADEQLLAEARQPLRQLMAQPDLLVVNLLRLERGARQSPYSRVSRLFRRHPAIRWSRPYHAMIDDSVLALLRRAPHWRIADCAIPALGHDGYRPELLQASDKAARLRRAMEADLEHHPGNPYACAKLGSLLVSTGELERGRALLRLGLENCGAEALAERFELLLHLALADDGGTAETLYRQALELPLPPRLTLAARLNLATLLLEHGNLEDAAALARGAAEAAPELALGWRSLGLIERRRGRLGEAIQAYRRSLSLEPDHPETHQNLAVALLLGGEIDGARAGFVQAISLLQTQGRHSEAVALRQQAGAMVKLNA